MHSLKFSANLNIVQAFQGDGKKLNIWGTAQLEAARRCESDWGDKIKGKGLKLPRSNAKCPKGSYISLIMRNVYRGWVNMRAYKGFVSGPKFTVFFR